MKKYRRIILCVLVIVITSLFLFNFTSCNRSYDEEEVIAATKILLKDAKMLNIVYYGSGIKYYDSEDKKGYYCKADTLHLEELGFSTVDELKALTEKTFSDEYSALLYSTVLSPIMSDTGVEVATRYYQVYDKKSGLPTHIMVHSNYSVLFKDDIEYDTDSLTVKGSKKDKVYVSVDATVTNKDGKTQKTTITITLVEEEDGWKIDNPIYANYNENKDRYDELKDKEFN